MSFFADLRLAWVLVAGLVGVVPSPARADEAAIRVLNSVTTSTDSAAARQASQTLVQAGANVLVPVLQGFQGATPLGSNWLRSVFETVAATERQAERELPAEQLTAFVRQTNQNPDARRLAWEWLRDQDEDAAYALLPGLLEDAHPDFRRDAVALLLEEAESADTDHAVQLYRQALKGAVHEDQVDTIASALKAAEEPIDVQQHFGFLADWKVVGPFDNREKKGYAVAYAPESELNLQAEYEGQLGQVMWSDISTDDDYGIVDIAEQIENYKGSLMYVTTTWDSSEEQPVEFRLGTPNAWKLWVNGDLVFEREEYHRSTRMDQFRIPVTLRAGSNVILLKVCQDEQEADWAQKYQFQLRVCSRSGAGLQPAGGNNE